MALSRDASSEEHAWRRCCRAGGERGPTRELSGGDGSALAAIARGGMEAAALWTVFVAVVISLGLTTHGMSRAAVALWRPVGVSAETPAVVLDAGGTLLVPLVGGFEQYPSVQGTATQTNPPSTSRPTGRPI